MGRTIVLTGVGRDRVGIVWELTELLHQLGCNLLDSSMTLLRGEFAIILMVQLPESQSLESMQSQLQELGKKMGLSFHSRELPAEELNESELSGNLHMISVYGADKPGIVAGITGKLAQLKANITDVATKYTGEGLFVMILEARVPTNVSTSHLETSLTEIAKQLQVDVSIQQLEVYQL